MGKPKESSDSIVSPVVPSVLPVASRRAHTAGDYLALSASTCGVGLIPLAPGTWGSLVGVGVFWLYGQLCQRLFPLPAFVEQNVGTLNAAQGLLRGYLGALWWRTSLLLLLIIAAVWLGIWAATRVERLLKRKDPGAVVIDEVAGQLITFLFVPFDAGGWWLAGGFAAFRLFDIWKPWPIRRLESLETGLGVMADDILAGFYAATLMSLLFSASLML